MTAFLNIEAYSFGRIVVNGITYTDDIKIVQEVVVSDWRRKRGHQVEVGDVNDVLGSSANIFVIGRGEPGLMQATSTLRQVFENKGIQLIEAGTTRAVKIFNQLLREGKDVSGGFHLTC
jgi:hypothetical protein